MNQNLSSYRIFYTVANTGNISKAAKELYISQPAISKSIQKLEDSVGCKLFFRSSRGVVLTEEGRLLYDHVSAAFETLTEGEEKLKRSIELGVGHLKIGVSSTLCKYLLMPYLKEFIRQNPHISISINCQSTNETLKLLENDKIDIGLIGKPESLKGIHFDYLEEIEDVFVATKEYLRNLKARGIAKDQILSSATLMLLDKNNMTRQYIDDYLLENQIPVQESIDISNMDLLIDFARIGAGVACVIRNFVRDDLANGSLMEIGLHAPIPKREVGFAYRAGVKPSKSLNEFIRFYRNSPVQNYAPSPLSGNK
jgi:DNA-binding transcriptional LysR family regulator